MSTTKTIKDDRQAVTTLKDQEWFSKSVLKGGLGFVMMGQSVSNLQLFIEDSKYYAEFGSSLRGGIPEFNVPVKPYSVAVSPKGGFSEENFRKGVSALLLEKLRNDLNTVNALMEHLKKDGIMDPSLEEITFDDIVESSKRFS
jgi:hypothetical protein